LSSNNSSTAIFVTQGDPKIGAPLFKDSKCGGNPGTFRNLIEKLIASDSSDN